MSKKIIIIEDDQDILDILTYILSDEGYEVLAYRDSKVLTEVLFYQPMLVLMDNRLDDGFGKDFCKKFKSNPELSHFPVVLMSANPGLEEMALESHADAYLKKPFNINELLDLVRRYG